MTPVKFDDIETAYAFVNFGEPVENSAVLCKTTGHIYYQSEYYDGDEDEKIPEDIEDDSKYVWIPRKNDLDLGRNLVFDFIGEFLPDQRERVNSFFQKEGAYARLKDLLEDHNMLEKWHAYEYEATDKALKEWCKENGIELAD